MGARYFFEYDVVNFLNASDSEEYISVEENHTSDESIHPNSESDCDTSYSEDDRDNVRSKDRKITWNADPFP
jgi:beta-lactamase class D